MQNPFSFLFPFFLSRPSLLGSARPASPTRFPSRPTQLGPTSLSLSRANKPHRHSSPRPLSLPLSLTPRPHLSSPTSTVPKPDSGSSLIPARHHAPCGACTPRLPTLCPIYCVAAPPQTPFAPPRTPSVGLAFAGLRCPPQLAVGLHRELIPLTKPSTASNRVKRRTLAPVWLRAGEASLPARRRRRPKEPSQTLAAGS